MLWRTGIMISVGVVAMAAPGLAQTAAPQEQELTCQLGGACDDSMVVGKEKAFSLAPIGGQAAAPAKSGARPKSGPRLAAPRQLPRGMADMALSFPLGSAVLTPEAKKRAETFAHVLKNPNGGLVAASFEIAGHTDAIGARAYNLDLSQRRAQSVVDYLVGMGVSKDRLKAAGYGFDKPVAGVGAKDPVNRRVEIVKTK